MWFLSNLFGFLAVAYLASLLSHRCGGKGAELEEKREELLDLQDFTEDIIHSMRGGLLTTDMEGRILLLNRTGEEILGHRFAAMRGPEVQEINPDSGCPGKAGKEKRYHCARRSTSVRRRGNSAISASAFRHCARERHSEAATYLISRT